MRPVSCEGKMGLLRGKGRLLEKAPLPPYPHPRENFCSGRREGSVRAAGILGHDGLPRPARSPTLVSVALGLWLRCCGGGPFFCCRPAVGTGGPALCELSCGWGGGAGGSVLPAGTGKMQGERRAGMSLCPPGLACWERREAVGGHVWLLQGEGWRGACRERFFARAGRKNFFVPAADGSCRQWFLKIPAGGLYAGRREGRRDRSWGHPPGLRRPVRERGHKTAVPWPHPAGKQGFGPLARCPHVRYISRHEQFFRTHLPRAPRFRARRGPSPVRRSA